LREAAAQADILLVLAPYTKDNDKIINAAVFDVMKPTGTFIHHAAARDIDEIGGAQQ
jgi:phosphoglycerate dehydrogenase-like enzyme